MKATGNEDSAFWILRVPSEVRPRVRDSTYLAQRYRAMRSTGSAYRLCGGGVRGIPSRPVTPNYVPSPMRGAEYDLRLRILRFAL